MNLKSTEVWCDQQHHAIILTTPLFIFGVAIYRDRASPHGPRFRSDAHHSVAPKPFLN